MLITYAKTKPTAGRQGPAFLCVHMTSDPSLYRNKRLQRINVTGNSGPQTSTGQTAKSLVLGTSAH